MKNMKVDLSVYKNMNICVAVSGGRDSMALLHYLISRAEEYGITVTALNCEHGLRGEDSVNDSQFVKDYCKTRNVPIKCYSADCGILAKDRGISVETAARNWRRECYADAAEHFNAAIATAHHLNDNAETVLFNLARGSGLAGLTGIGDTYINVSGVKPLKLIRPLIGCSREEIDEYISENNIPYVEDKTNLTDDYTRNKIRHNVLPELEKAVSGAAAAIYRFSRIAAEDEEYFKKLIAERGIVRRTPLGYEIMHCNEKPIFKRAVLQVTEACAIKDYTSDHLERLYALQFAEKGKKFEFLGLTAFKEEGKIAICIDFSAENSENSCPFLTYFNEKRSTWFGQYLYIGKEESATRELPENPKILKLDLNKIPETAVIRQMREGDRFKKFGGGTKNLGDYFTDKKIPVRIRKQIPVIADGREILVVCGVEISDRVKVDDSTKAVALCIAEDYVKLSK